MSKGYVLLVFIFLLVAFNVSADWEKKDYVTYFGTTDKTITCTWDSSTGATSYQVELLHVERDATTIVAVENLVATQITFSLPRSGHFVARIRACPDDLEQCSGWSESVDPLVSSVDGQSRAWWIYGYVAPPGTPSISSQ